jgi:hypothetical protein
VYLCRPLRAISSVGLEHSLDRAGVVGSNPSLPTKGTERFPFYFPKKLERTGVRWVPTQARLGRDTDKQSFVCIRIPHCPQREPKGSLFYFQKSLKELGSRGSRRKQGLVGIQTSRASSVFESLIAHKGNRKVPFLFPKMLDRDGGSNPIIRFHSGGKNALIYKIILRLRFWLFCCQPTADTVG